MLLVACIYAFLALLGQGHFSRAPGGHAVAELQHISNKLRTGGEREAELDVFRPALPDRSGRPSEIANAPSAGGATLRLVPQGASQNVGALAWWLGLATIGWSEPVASTALPWPDSLTPGAILGHWHRSVVLHL